MRKLKQFFKNNLVQRLLYFVLLITYNFIFFNDRIPSIMKWQEYVFLNSSVLGIPYIYLWLIPSFMFFYQIIFNNFIGWMVIFSTFIFLIIFGIIKSVYSMIDNLGMKYDVLDIVMVVIISIILYTFLGTFLYLLKPNRK